MLTEEQVWAVIEKYGDFFYVEREHLPQVEVRNNLGSKWYARTVWHPSRPTTSTIQIQKVALEDERTLERIVAHEMIHHVNFLRMSAAERAALKHHRGFLSDDHGRKFHEMAALVNAEMGDGFVTERSDEDFEVAANDKTFFILIEPVMSGKMLGWSWAAKLSKQAEEEVQRRTSHLDDVVLVQTTDERFTKGVKIKRYGGCSVPKPGSEDAATLQELYETAMRR